MRVMPITPVHPVVRVQREPLKNQKDSPYNSWSTLVARIKSMNVDLTFEEKEALEAAALGSPTAQQARLLRDIVEEDGK